MTHDEMMAKETPWGKPHDCCSFGDGIWWVSTASHGGYYLEPNRIEEIRSAMPFTEHLGCWWEKHCDGELVKLCFAHLFSDYQIWSAVTQLEAFSKWGKPVWDDAWEWLQMSDRGIAIRIRAANWASTNADMWVRGSCGTISQTGVTVPPGVMWCWFRRVSDGQRIEVWLTIDQIYEQPYRSLSWLGHYNQYPDNRNIDPRPEGDRENANARETEEEFEDEIEDEFCDLDW